jgi:hypothetical protein
MKRNLMAAVLVLGGAASAGAQQELPPWKGYNRGVRWETSLDAARARAAKEGKPILLYQLVGNLAKEGC